MSFKFYEGEPVPTFYTADEEREVVSLLAAGDGKNARFSLIEHNLRLVIRIASGLAGDPVEQEDLISVGIIGLIKAADTFDPDRNVRFCTYASRCIKNEIFAYMRKGLKTFGEVSLEEVYGTDGEGNLRYPAAVSDCVHDPIEDRIEEDNEKSSLREALEGLDARERDFIEMRFGLRDESGSYMTQAEIAKVMGVSQAYLSKFEKKVIKHLREEIASAERS